MRKRSSSNFRALCSSLVMIAAAITTQGATFSNSGETDAVFSAAIEAVGGEKEIGKIRSIEAFADCTGPKGKYTTEIISFAPKKTLFRQIFSYRDPGYTIIDGDLAWERSGNSGEFSIASPVSRLFVRLHEFQLMAFDFRRMFHDFSLAGTEMFENRPSVKVSAKTELDIPIFLFFDVETKLLSGYVLMVPNSGKPVKNVFNKWENVGQLKLPSMVTATDNSGEWVLRFHKITLNKTKERIFDVPEQVKDIAGLLRLHEQQKTAHLNYDAGLFVEMFDEKVTQIQRGAVSTGTKAENLARFKKYFESFKFQEWEDIKPPVIRVSKDGSMATIVVQKRVIGTYKDESGQDKTAYTEFAWLEVWEKIAGKWKLVTIASTENAGEAKTGKN